MTTYNRTDKALYRSEHAIVCCKIPAIQHFSITNVDIVINNRMQH